MLCDFVIHFFFLLYITENFKQDKLKKKNMDLDSLRQEAARYVGHAVGTREYKLAVLEVSSTRRHTVVKLLFKMFSKKQRGGAALTKVIIVRQADLLPPYLGVYLRTLADDASNQLLALVCQD